MRRDGGAWGRATVVAAALAAAGALIAVVAYLTAYLAADHKASPVAPSKTASGVEPALPARRPSAVAQLVFESGSAELPVDALTQTAVVLAAADQALISVRSFHDDDGKGNAAALAAARARAVVELLELAGVPAARIDLSAAELRVPGKDGRKTERIEVSTR